MAKPQTPMAITLEDLVNCGQGDVIISILIDAKAFYDYDQREVGQNLTVEHEMDHVLDGLENEAEHDPKKDKKTPLGGGTLTFGVGSSGGQFNEV
jgi:hypothetical protein